MLSVKISITSQTLQPAQWKEARLLKVLFQITPTNVNSPGNANPYVAGGDTLDLTGLENLPGAPPGFILPTFEIPLNIPILSVPPAPGPATIFTYRFCPGTTLKNGTMQVLSGGAEIAAGNYPAGVLADTIIGEAYFVMP